MTRPQKITLGAMRKADVRHGTGDPAPAFLALYMKSSVPYYYELVFAPPIPRGEHRHCQILSPRLSGAFCIRRLPCCLWLLGTEEPCPALSNWCFALTATPGAKPNLAPARRGLFVFAGQAAVLLVALRNGRAVSCIIELVFRPLRLSPVGEHRTKANLAPARSGAFCIRRLDCRATGCWPTCGRAFGDDGGAAAGRNGERREVGRLNWRSDAGRAAQEGSANAIASAATPTARNSHPAVSELPSERANQPFMVMPTPAKPNDAGAEGARGFRSQ
jgi:hypothetical protein